MHTRSGWGQTHRADISPLSSASGAANHPPGLSHPHNVIRPMIEGVVVVHVFQYVIGHYQVESAVVERKPICLT